MWIQHRFNKIFKHTFIAFILFQSTGCSFSFDRWEYHKGLSAFEDRNYDEALRYFDKIISKSPGSATALDSARKGVQVATFNVKNFDQAIRFLEHLASFSKNPQERIDSQKTIGDIYFENKLEYEKAIAEYEKLSGLSLDQDLSYYVKFQVAKAYTYLNRYRQAESEVKLLYKMANSEAKTFEIDLFLANIYFNSKRMDQAIEMFKQIDSKFPELANKEKVKMSLVVCYEELGRFEEAIELLEKMKKQNSEDEYFLSLKIARLQQRIRDLPGSRGLRK